jgi:tRNA nucleotidyltransferase/poly(A) polymerase
MDTNSPTYKLARQIVATLHEQGHTAYFAGGCVRDVLLHRPPKDYDVATSARPEEVLHLFPRGQKVGAAFGVILIRQQGAQVEVATFRTDGDYHDGRHPDSVQFSTPEVDAQRRDFTCNGLFYDPRTHQVFDYVGGQQDISQRILRAIGIPAQRFAEDHLRMLRAVRFTTRLQFAMDPATAEAIQEAAPQIQRITRERIGEEMRLMLEAPARAASMRLLCQLGLFEQIWPAELDGAAIEDFPTLERLQSAVPRWLGLLAMQIDVAALTGKSLEPAAVAQDLRSALVLSNVETEAITWSADRWIAARDGQAMRDARWKRIMGDPRWPDLANLIRASAFPNQADLDALWDRLTTEGVSPEPYVNGSDLIALGATPGHQFKIWLDELYDRQLEREFPEPSAAHAAARMLIEKSRAR